MKSMKRKMSVFAVAALCVLALGVIAGAQGKAANVAGAWKIAMMGRNGEVTNDLTVMQSGGTLSGTFKTAQAEVPINGTIDGNNIDFTMKVTGRNGEQTNEYKGTVDGDTMKGTMSNGQRMADFTGRAQQVTARSAGRRDIAIDRAGTVGSLRAPVEVRPGALLRGLPSKLRVNRTGELQQRVSRQSGDWRSQEGPAATKLLEKPFLIASRDRIVIWRMSQRRLWFVGLGLGSARSAELAATFRSIRLPTTPVSRWFA